MGLFESDWFFKMVEQQGNSPVSRLLAVFSVAEQWFSAPGIKNQFTADQMNLSNSRLNTYLVETARSAKIENPSMLATQLIILLQGGIAEELRDSGAHAMENANKAAQVIVGRECETPKKHRITQLAAVASLAVAAVSTVTWQVQSHYELFTRTTYSTASMKHVPYFQVTDRMPMGVNPSEMEATLNLQEKFQRGVCPAPHLMVLPQGQMTAYMNVVNFRTPDNPAADRDNLHSFLVWFNQKQATECYYAPVNGHTMVTWR